MPDKLLSHDQCEWLVNLAAQFGRRWRPIHAQDDQWVIVPQRGHTIKSLAQALSKLSRIASGRG